MKIILVMVSKLSIRYSTFIFVHVLSVILPSPVLDFSVIEMADETSLVFKIADNCRFTRALSFFFTPSCILFIAT